MEIKRTISRIAYHIEPKPEGGFIARCSDSTVPPLEAPTRLELERQIQEKITAEITSQFPGLKLSLGKPETKFFSIDMKPDVGAVSQPGDASTQPADNRSKQAVEQWLVDKAVLLLDKNLPAELAEQLKTQAHEGKLQISLTKGGTPTEFRREYVVSTGKAGELTSNFLTAKTQKTSGGLEPSTPVSASFSNTSLDTSSPITPVSSNGSFLRFLLAALVVIGLFLLFFHIKK
jgi:hypothetical protein